MISRSRPAARRRDDDGGFTLIEVIVALVILGVVATASLAFFIRAMQSTTDLQRRQAAVGVANEAMEDVRAVSVRPMGSSGVSALAYGRTAAAVAAVPLGGDDAASMWASVDVSATGASTPIIPISRPVTDRGVTYTVTTLIGACFRATAGVDPPCGRSVAAAEEPISVVGYVKMVRVIITVTWSAIKDACGATACSYRIVGLVDPSTDAVWNTIVSPVAYDDAIAVLAGSLTMIDVLGNDQVPPVGPNPTSVVSDPSGSAIAQGDGKISYQAPPPGGSGIYHFTYRFAARSGPLSNIATVAVAVVPRAVDDAGISTSAGATITIPVTANDVATPDFVTIFGAPPSANGTTTASGTSITYVASNTFVGDTTFTYVVTDTSGQVSAPATVTVTTTSAVDPALVADVTIDVPVTVGQSANDLALMAKSNNVAGSTLTVVATTPTDTALTVDGQPWGTHPTGTVIRFAQAGSVTGTYAFTYYATNSAGVRTVEQKTVTINVLAAP